MKQLNMTGQQFGRLTVLNYVKKVQKRYYWKCLCICGRTTLVSRANLVSRQVQSCGCLQKEKARNCRFVDLTGRRYGRLVVVSLSHLRNHRYYWKVRCDCGNEKIVVGSKLNGGCIRSCRCLNAELSALRKFDYWKTHRHHWYVDGLDSISRQNCDRNNLLSKWYKAVKRRDGYVSAISGKRGTRENPCHAHHICSKAGNRQVELDLENGITLLADEHTKFHQLFGKNASPESLSNLLIGDHISE